MRIKLYTSHLGRNIFGRSLEHPEYIGVSNNFGINSTVNLTTVKLGRRVIEETKDCSKNVKVDVSPYRDHNCCCC